MRLRRFLRNRALRVGRRVVSPLRRWRTSREPRVVALHDVHRRLELLLLAMYKKVDRLKPRDPEIAKNLAALYAAQGLIVDARAQYLIVADAYGAHLHCEGPEHKLAAATRKQMTVRFAMAAALRINRLVDPQGHADFWE